MPKTIKIIHYKAGNIASVKNAFARLGITLEGVSSPEEIRNADKLIFPGVGHARPAMELLKTSGMADAIQGFTGPVLGICLGMQLMASMSEEGDTVGLNLFPEKIRRFRPGENMKGLKVPHMGWNDVFRTRGALFEGIPEGSYFYFVHSYYMEESPSAIALCNYGTPFSAATERKNFYGVQFHPEKSGEAGMTLLKNFIAL
ncbi:MAG: imidazole glycerol phosphate synthase subunit HisH [Desulfosarcina sp.]|nr:imidazole glycerol phosphate synthase subunit HisH [Desulfosarcina sp.]